MAKKKEIHLDPSGLKFSIFSSDEIRRLSVVKVSTPKGFDELGNPLMGGLYDLSMGPSTRDDVCKTCFRRDDCEGHFGSIELCLPVYNPFFIKLIYNVLRINCLSCHRIQLSDHVKQVTELQLQLIDAGFIIEAEELEQYKSETVNSAEVKVKLEGGSEVHPKIASCLELLGSAPHNFYSTKSSEAIRNAIIANTLVECYKKKCIHCKEPMKRVKFSYKRLVFGLTKGDMKVFYENQEDEKLEKIKATNQPILADECRRYLRSIYATEEQFLKLLFPIIKGTKTEGCPFDAFFMDVVPVTPPSTRPVNKLRNEILEHSQTTIYKDILKANAFLRSVLQVIKGQSEGQTEPENEENPEISAELQAIYNMAHGASPDEKLFNAWSQLQAQVDLTLDNNQGPSTAVKSAGLKQTLEKKEGIIRMHMMGKRVNFAARTVITPDPNIGVDEIGIPEAFALKLTYPTPVTPWNVQEMRRYVTNGPEVHPGACYVENERGFKHLIPAKDESKRETLAKTLLTADKGVSGVKIVHRHLQNGDMLLLNRQPSLHRPSIMAHKARILKGEKTFRLHYSNCKSYNADFDGDEMNAHFMQNEVGRSEARHLVNVASNYLVPKDGTPLGGLIQDHIISGVKLMIRGRLFNQHDYQQLVFQGLSRKTGELKLLPPCVLKPKALWSGKQVVSTIILNLTPEHKSPLNMTSTAKIGAKAWQNCESRPWQAGGTPLEGNSMSEAEVIIRNGELLCGILDKNHCGSTPYGMVHCMYELYGGEVSTSILSSFSKLFTYYLQREGFTLGVRDILVLEKADKKRSKIIKKCRQAGKTAASAALELEPAIPDDELAEKMDEAYIRNPKFRTIIDRKYKSVLDSFTNDINKTCIPAGLVAKFPTNNLQLMVMSGAKGSTVNTMQISSLLGQIELEGKRPPLMISRKSLPSFATFETSPRSGGFIDGRFLSGIRPQEFFFHCMAGREGLIDTAVKTSRSGYLQRCLIKHLEGLKVDYDLTVRDSDNSVIQFMYGEDGMDIAKCQYLKLNQLSFLNQNFHSIVSEKLLEQLNDDETGEVLRKHKKKLKAWIKKYGSPLEVRRASPFLSFAEDVKSNLNVKNPHKNSDGRTKLSKALIQAWRGADEEVKAQYNAKKFHCPDPIISQLRPDNNFGSVSEYLETLIQAHSVSNKESKEQLLDIMYVKSTQALAAPGEPVGLLAAQSIGEPSTQMTLNTFHFAGRGEMNVTLGIPRLREILMMASKNIKTPSMDIPFLPHPNQEKIAEKIRTGFNRVTVSNVLKDVTVKSRLIYSPERTREYILRFNFLPREAYKTEFSVKPMAIIKHMTEKYFKVMFRAIMLAVKEKNSIIEIQTEKKGAKAPNEGDEEEGESRTDVNKKFLEAQDSSDEEEEVPDDADATEMRTKGRQGDEKDYEEPEEEEKDEDEDDEEDKKPVQEVEEDVKEVEEPEEESEEVAKMMRDLNYVQDYTFDKEKHLWCQIRFCLPMKYKNIDLTNLIRSTTAKSVIYEIPRINRAITYLNNDKLTLKTDGINISAMFNYDKILDLNKLYTNDIHGVARTYGIEAASRVIVKEVQNVFKVYGIVVDPRHLLLIADYMTFDGTFQPMSRKGMESSASPLQQMSFESSLVFLKAATIQGRLDSLDSPSSRLIVGQPCKTGTGCFDLLNDPAYVFRSMEK